MYCPKCKAENFSKDGTVNGQNLYSCAVCGFNMIIPIVPDSENADKKREALILYFAGYDIQDVALLSGLEQEEVNRLIKGFAT